MCAPRPPAMLYGVIELPLLSTIVAHIPAIYIAWGVLCLGLLVASAVLLPRRGR